MIDFTVLIPVYNTPPLILKEAIGSILNQSHPTNKILIVDDGSTEIKTVRCLDEFAENPIITVHTLDKNRGVSHALNVGHSIIDSEYVALMGSDDISHVDRFKKQIKILRSNPKIDVLGTQLSCFYDHDFMRKSIFSSNHKQRPVPGKGWQTNHGTVIYRNQAVKDVGGYNVDLRKAQDVDLFNKMMAAGKVFFNHHQVLYYWRRYLRA